MVARLASAAAAWLDGGVRTRAPTAMRSKKYAESPPARRQAPTAAINPTEVRDSWATDLFQQRLREAGRFQPVLIGHVGRLIEGVEDS